uniref:Uncharacterized protein n=1 Tax=Glossina brevipalpis TaxID=37001 RepID=A0A1A9WTL3_9MUSC
MNSVSRKLATGQDIHRFPTSANFPVKMSNSVSYVIHNDGTKMQSIGLGTYTTFTMTTRTNDTIYAYGYLILNTEGLKSSNYDDYNDLEYHWRRYCLAKDS